jgi:thiamine biosynthesis lipoprotein
MQTFIFEAIGTHWKIEYYFQGQALEIEKIIKERIEQFDKNYSRFRSDSLVTQWSQKAGEYELPNDAKRLFEFYKKLYDATDGLVTPLIGKTMEQAGYDAEYSLKPKKLIPPPKWEDTLEFPRTGLGNSKLIVKQAVLLDFGAAGKGYVVDIIAHLLYTNGIDQFCINAGGDIFARNLTQTIGLEDPDDTERILGTVEIKDGALCASAGNRRKWQDYHHIINPKTLKPVEDIKATWVTAENTMLADGIATALFFVTPAKLLRTFQFEYAMIEGEDLKYSNNFKAKFFT